MVNRDELLAQARRRYPDFLRSVVTGLAFFPFHLRTGKTRRAAAYAERAGELTNLREAAKALNFIVEWQEVRDLRFGLHQRPAHAFFADETAYLGALGKNGEVSRFRTDLTLIRTECPILEPWLAANVQLVVQHHGHWLELLRVLRWFCENPCSGLYLRQLPVEGVDTKFFERQEAILDALLLYVQPDRVNSAGRHFETRHGLRREEALVRLRFLDSTLQAERQFPVNDLAVPAVAFRQIRLQGTTAIITENLRNFLALPPLRGCVAVLGNGGAAALLAGAPWLAQSRILYWGDMDPHGYAILARLRGEYPQTESVLMDLSTLQIHHRLTVKAIHAPMEINLLTPEERAALDYLYAEGHWLEQERIPYRAVTEAFAKTLLFMSANDSTANVENTFR